MRSDRAAVSLALRVSSCLKRNGRSEVEPVEEVIAAVMSAAMMVVRPSCLALASEALTMVSDKALSWSRKQDTASAPTRKLEWALMKASTVLGFVIPGFGMFSNITEFGELCHFRLADSLYLGGIGCHYCY